jgi:hypothetical protein
MKFYHWFSSHPNEQDLSGDVSKLQEIGKELRIVDARQQERPMQTDFRRISSVPDIWSQHRLFEMLLLNKAEDPSYLEYEAIAKREWRAMLAILVLAESYGVTIYSETIRFSDKVSSPYLRAAYSTRPNPEQFSNMVIYYILNGDVRYPIAMSSPTVHVIPTKDAWRYLRSVYPGRIPWITDNRVYAPIVEEEAPATPFLLGEQETERYPAMMPVHALMLQRWLSKYRADLAAKQRREGNTSALLNLKLVSGYEEALSTAYGLSTEGMPIVESFFESAERQDGMQIGDMRVPRNLKVFLDRVFYSIIDQSSAMPEILDTHRFAGGIAKECLVSKTMADGRTAHFFVAMPVTEMLWKLWQDNEEKQPTYRLQCLFASDGVTMKKVKASVVIGDITFARSYSIAQIEQESWRNLCTAGVWPRQKIEGWKDYFLFCNEIGGYQIKPEHDGLIAHKRSHRGKESLEGALHHYKLNAAPERCRLERNDALIGYLQVRERSEIPAGDTSKTYHAAIDFGTSATTLYGGIDEAAPAKLTGMNLWSLPLINTLTEDGVETSRLEQYFFPPLPLPLALRTKNAAKGEATRLDYAALLEKPEALREFQDYVPMQTILSDASEENGAKQVFVDSWIFSRAYIFPRKDENWPKKYSNLKWNRSAQADQFRIKAILAEFLMMLALEARVNRCGKLSLTASYPLSFEKRIKKSYFDALNEMLLVTGERTATTILPPPVADGGAAAGGENAPLVGSITESEAVLRYSIKQDTYNQNYFVIDIGGGSTDIFISLIDEKHRRNSFAASLGFGARKVLVDKICSNDSLILRKLMEKSSVRSNLVIRDPRIFMRQLENTQGRRSMVEDLFTFRVMQDRTNAAAAASPESYGESFIVTCAESMLDASLQKDDPKAYQEDLSFLELKKRIAFYLGASVWLSGLMVRGAEGTDMNVSLLFAGNGSKMIRWLSPDIERIRHFITLLFQSASRSAVTSDMMSCRFSAKPKEEVAYGALVDIPAGFASAQTGATKRVHFGGTDQQTDDIGAFHSMEYVSTNIETNADEFIAFMEEYRRSAYLSFGWDFFKDEYDPAILAQGRFRSAIGQTVPDNGYFLNALDVVAAQHIKTEQEKLTY